MKNPTKTPNHSQEAITSGKKALKETSILMSRDTNHSQPLDKTDGHTLENSSDADILKSDDEILKVYNECIGKLNAEDVDTSSLEEFKNVIIPMMEQAYKKAIALSWEKATSQAREDCEKEFNEHKYPKIWNDGLKHGQKAERERILEILDKRIRYIKSLRYNQKGYSAGRLILKTLEELKKEVLKDTEEDLK